MVSVRIPLRATVGINTFNTIRQCYYQGLDIIENYFHPSSYFASFLYK